jgi:hypothetical protein
VARFGSDSGTGGGVREEVAEAVAYLGAEPLGPVPEVPVEDGEMLCVPVEDETWAVVRALQGRINGIMANEDVCGVLKSRGHKTAVVHDVALVRGVVDASRLSGVLGKHLGLPKVSG